MSVLRLCRAFPMLTASVSLLRLPCYLQMFVGSLTPGQITIDGHDTAPEGRQMGEQSSLVHHWYENWFMRAVPVVRGSIGPGKFPYSGIVMDDMQPMTPAAGSQQQQQQA